VTVLCVEKRGQFETLYCTGMVFSTNYERNVYVNNGKGLQPVATCYSCSPAAEPTSIKTQRYIVLSRDDVKRETVQNKEKHSESLRGNLIRQMGDRDRSSPY